MELFELYFLDVIRTKYAKFEGRARRSEYWYFFLFSIIVYLALKPLGLIVFKADLVALLFGLVIFIPSLALNVRRLHDIGITCWFVLVGVIPYLGWAVLLYCHVLDSQAGSNQYGPNPKG